MPHSGCYFNNRHPTWYQERTLKGSFEDLGDDEGLVNRLRSNIPNTCQSQHNGQYLLCFFVTNVILGTKVQHNKATFVDQIDVDLDQGQIPITYYLHIFGMFEPQIYPYYT